MLQRGTQKKGRCAARLRRSKIDPKRKDRQVNNSQEGKNQNSILPLGPHRRRLKRLIVHLVEASGKSHDNFKFSMTQGDAPFRLNPAHSA